MPADDFVRELLPADVIPVAYDVTLQPDLHTFTFAGSLKLLVEVDVSCSEIHLHAKELQFSDAQFRFFADGTEGEAELGRAVGEIESGGNYADSSSQGDDALPDKSRMRDYSPAISLLSPPTAEVRHPTTEYSAAEVEFLPKKATVAIRFGEDQVKFLQSDSCILTLVTLSIQIWNSDDSAAQVRKDGCCYNSSHHRGMSR